VAGGLAAAFADSDANRFADVYSIADADSIADASSIVADGYERFESDARLDPRGDAGAVTKSGNPLATKVVGTLIPVSMRRCGDGEDSKFRPPARPSANRPKAC
jgi:hypothetical protein